MRRAGAGGVPHAENIAPSCMHGCKRWEACQGKDAGVEGGKFCDVTWMTEPLPRRQLQRSPAEQDHDCGHVVLGPKVLRSLNERAGHRAGRRVCGKCGEGGLAAVCRRRPGAGERSPAAGPAAGQVLGCRRASAGRDLNPSFSCTRRVHPTSMPSPSALPLEW